MKNTILFSWCISGMLMWPGQVFAQQYTFVSIDVQCPATADPSECPAGLAPGQLAAQTGARGINARGDVVGFYVAGGKQRAFLLKDGEYTSLEFPVPGVRATVANGVNAQGEIVGQYTLPVHNLNNPPPENSPLYCPSATDPACTKGFHYWHGRFTTVMFPTTVDENGQPHVHPGAIAQRITDDGDIYGCVHDHDLGQSMFGAVWTRYGAFSLMSNGGEVSDPMAVPMSMNNGGTPGKGKTIVGFFTDMSNRQHGYVVRDAMLEAYDPTPTTTVTAIWDINPGQQFVGTYRELGEVAAKRHAFLQNPDGSLPITFDFTCQETTGCAGAPRGTVAFATVAFGVNPDALIVGQYLLVNGGAPHGYVAIPADTN
jgi:probable HAF family extracellular repeat protein